MVRCSWQPATPLGARNFTTRQLDTGPRPAASSLRAVVTQRRCCSMGKCSSRAVSTMAFVLRPRSSTIRPLECGRPRVKWPSLVSCTQQHCSRTERYWWLEGSVTVLVCVVQSSTTQLLGLGSTPAIKLPRAGAIPRHCCLTVRSSSQEDPLASAFRLRSRNSTTRQLERGQQQATCTTHARFTLRLYCLTGRCWSQ